MSFLGRRYFKLPILSCPRIPPATQANASIVNHAQGKRRLELIGESHGIVCFFNFCSKRQIIESLALWALL